MERSRLKGRAQSQSKKTILFSLIGIIIIVFLLFKFGLPLVINLSLFVSGSKNSNELTTSKKANFVAPPVLNPQPSATNSANIIVSGIAGESQTISLYVNDELVDKTKAQKNGSFEFTDVALSKGENTIKAKATTEGDKDSDYSDTITILYKSGAPKLDITSPSEGQSYSKDDNKAQVAGQTDEGVKVTVNDFWAVVDDNGNFSYTLPLKEGDNEVKIIAADDAGNKTEKTLKVIYSR